MQENLYITTYNDKPELWTKEKTGGKAFHLYKMKKNDFPVPDFVCIGSEAVNFLLKNVRSKIENICNKVSINNIQESSDLSKEITEIIENIAVTDDFKTSFLKQLEHFFKPDEMLSVRSSATDEDAAKNSFAGIHDSFLFVQQADILSYVFKCIASAWSPGAISYRLINKLPVDNIGISVVIQKMVDAEKSGICFSVNDGGNLADIVIVAGYGAGEGIVSDKVEADSCFVNRFNDSIVYKNTTKKIKFVLDLKNGGLKSEKVDANLMNEQCLTKNDILKIKDFSIRAEKLLKKPSDIEFSFDKNKQLYILQMRPITTTSQENIKILDNTNIVESYPGITLPLSFSFAKQAYKKVFTESAKAFLLSPKLIQKQSETFENLIAHAYGRIYYRLDNWYKLIGLVSSSKKAVRHWENAVGLQTQSSDFIQISLAGKIKSFFALLKLLFNFKNISTKFFKDYHTWFPLLNESVNNFSDKKELWNKYTIYTDKLFKRWYLTIINDFIAFKSFGLLQQLIKKYGVSNDPKFVNNLLSGLGKPESEKAVLETLDMKEIIKNNKDLNEIFSLPSNLIIHKLEKHNKPFLKRIYSYIEQYGDRTLAELKLENPSLRDDPEIFIKLLQSSRVSKLTKEKFINNQNQVRAAANEQLSKHMKFYKPRRYILKFLLKTTSKGLQNRENMRFARARAYGAVKRIFKTIGNIMLKENFIDEVNDVFYLSLDEVENFCTQKTSNNLKEKIKEIKKQYTDFKNLKLPDRIIYANDKLPSFYGENDFRDTSSDEKELFGTAVSKGCFEGEAIVIDEPDWSLDVKNKIIVTQMTDPGWVFLMLQASGLISEKGSLLSHTAIIGRELDIPVVIGVNNASSKIKTGDIIKINGDTGKIEIKK